MARHKHQGTYKDGNGRRINEGTVSVYLAGTSTAANVYAASSGGSAVNSVETDSRGSYEFWVDDGDYSSDQLFKITMSKANFGSSSYDDVRIFPYASAGYTEILAPDKIKGGALNTNGHDIPNVADDVFTLNDATQTLTNKTLTLPQINDTSADHQYILGVSELAADRTVTLPLLTGNDTFTFNDFAATLQNKTLTSPIINTPSSSGHVYGGTSTPTLTGVANVASTGSPKLIFSRNGTTIKFILYFTVTPTAATTVTIIRFTLPVASDFAGTEDLIGTVTCTEGTNYLAGKAYSDFTNDEGRVEFYPATNNQHKAYVSGQYTII